MAIADSNEAKKDSFPIEAKRGILAIYRDPIVQSSIVDFFNDEENLKDFKDLFSEKEWSEIVSTSNQNQRANRLFDAFLRLENPKWFYVLANFIRQHNVFNPKDFLPGGLDFYESFQGQEVRDTENYLQVVSHAPELIAGMKSFDVLNGLRESDSIDRGESAFLEILVETEMGENVSADVRCEKANRMLLSIMANKSRDWYWTFMQAIPEALRLKINPNFAADLEVWKQNSSLAERKEKSEIAEEFDEFAGCAIPPEKLEEMAKNFRLSELNSEVFGDSDRFAPEIRYENLELRNYQKELAAPALQGENCIICAPTGSGKTLVAAKIISEHFKSAKSGAYRKVAFFAPTVPLAEQQFRVFQRFLGRQIKKIEILHGGISFRNLIDADRTQFEIIKENEIVVMTPAIFVNVMRHPEPLQRLKIDVFTMIVFDECHHTVGEHNYSLLMREYFAFRAEAEKKNGKFLPQIVGLSASVGVQAKGYVTSNFGEASRPILTLCAHLDCTKISTVQTPENDREMLACVNIPREEIVQVPKMDTKDDFVARVVELMRMIEKKAIPLMKAANLISANANAPKKQQMIEHWLPQYQEQWLGPLTNETFLSTNSDVAQELIPMLKFLKIYHETLIMAQHVPLRQTLEFVEEKISAVETGRTEIYEWLLAAYEERFAHMENAASRGFCVNRLIPKLKEILLKEYEDPKKNSRTLIFVKTRDLTISLLDFLRADEDLAALKPVRLVSAQIRLKDRATMSEEEQQEALDGFRLGVNKVMIATSIGDEGLDVASCNLVIKYNHVSSAIAMIQRRGRGRAAGSRSILLADDALISIDEVQKLCTERLVEQCLVWLRGLSDDQFKKQIRDIQIMEQKQRMVKEHQKEEHRQKMMAKNFSYKIICKCCSAQFCDANDVRLVVAGRNSRPVIVDPEIWGKVMVNVLPESKATVFDVDAQLGKLYCKNCQHSIGTVFQYLDSVWLPQIKFKGKVKGDRAGVGLLRMQTNTKYIPSSWAAVEKDFFIIKEIAEEDVQRMFRALNPPAFLEAVKDFKIHEMMDWHDAGKNSPNFQPNFDETD